MKRCSARPRRNVFPGFCASFDKSISCLSSVCAINRLSERRQWSSPSPSPKLLIYPRVFEILCCRDLRSAATFRATAFSAFGGPPAIDRSSHTTALLHSRTSGGSVISGRSVTGFSTVLSQTGTIHVALRGNLSWVPDTGVVVALPWRMSLLSLGGLR